MAHTSYAATVLTIAGSDPGAGAGIQADLKTFAACGVYGCAVVTALTAQNTAGVAHTWALPAGAVAGQLETLLADISPAAIKIGMLHNAVVVREVAAVLGRYPALPIVLDPIIRASSGAPLLAAEAVGLMVAELFPLAALVTPNLDEAAALLNSEPAADRNRMVEQARQLLELGPGAVLLTGGHLPGAEVVDVLVQPAGQEVHYEFFAGHRIDTANTHGTGCALSSAIAAGLARGHELKDAVGDAKQFVQQALEHGRHLSVGQSTSGAKGPIHHLYRFE